LLRESGPRKILKGGIGVLNKSKMMHFSGSKLLINHVHVTKIPFLIYSKNVRHVFRVSE